MLDVAGVTDWLETPNILRFVLKRFLLAISCYCFAVLFFYLNYHIYMLQAHGLTDQFNHNFLGFEYLIYTVLYIFTYELRF